MKKPHFTPSRKYFRIGFTLIELLVVISVIGILAALLLANFAGARDRADDARLKSNLKQLQTAMRLKYNDTQHYDATASLSLTGYADGTLLSDLQTAQLKYSSAGGDSYVACIPLSNANDREKEVLGAGGKCDSEPAGTPADAFCVCSN